MYLKDRKGIRGVAAFLLWMSVQACPLFLPAQAGLFPGPAGIPAGEFEKIRRVPVPERPFLFVNREEIALARKRAETEAWAKDLKSSYLKIADTWIDRDYDFIKKVIPPQGSIYTYGAGLNLDPVDQKKMIWKGWEDPRHVKAANGAVYPNAAHPDDGSGWTDPESKKKYYFMALANGMTVNQLETSDLPALVNAYLLTGKEVYAERALWILDAIATIYPRAYEGPIDYPHLAPGKVDGGRLQQPYYQAAKALTRYGYFTEVLSMSAHASKPSLSNGGYTMLRNIELNMLMNGADYCLRMARAGRGASYELNNGNIDYNRAPLLVGALLGVPEWVEWALNGPLGFRYVLSNTIDINGRYFESSPIYASHTRDLLLSTAYFLRRMRLPAYPNGYEAFDDARFAQFALDFFTGIQVAGRLPLFGDSRTDLTIQDDGRIFDGNTLLAAHQFYRYSTNKELRDAALQRGAQMLRDMPAGYQPGEDYLLRMQGWEEFIRQARSTAVRPPAGIGSTLLFDYGTLILRSGEREKERAALVRFGPTLTHGQADELGLGFYAKGREFSADPGHYGAHLRLGYTKTTVAHNALVVNRTNQLKKPSPGGDLQTWTDGQIVRSAAINDPQVYSEQGVKVYKRRVALIDLSDDDSYIVDNFWAQGGMDYDYSLHGVMNGKLKVVNTGSTILKATRGGSVLSEDIDHAAKTDLNYRVTSYPDKEYYFAPPGAGYGFLSQPAFYRINGPVQLNWSATDQTGHQMHVFHFAPPSAELITAESPKAAGLDATYALSRVRLPATEMVRFTSVIQPTAGESKLKEVHQLRPLDGSRSAFGLRLIPSSPGGRDVREHVYIASDKPTGTVSFDGGISFAGEEGFLGLDASGKVISVSLTGEGRIGKGNFGFELERLFTGPLKIVQVKSQPLRILVDAPEAQARQLAGSALRLNKPSLSRPFVLRVIKSESAGRQTWLTLDASSNVQAIGTVKSYDPGTKSLATEAQFPRTRPYQYTYDDETGMPRSDILVDYNGGYNGFWVVTTDPSGKERYAGIKNMLEKRTKVLLHDPVSPVFFAGQPFEIRLLAPGDELEIPVWGEAKRGPDGKWKISGPGRGAIKE